jgi:hypothetical protein
MSNRNATASWSGYSHQGLVGILVALKEMRVLISEERQKEFDIHFLEYENNEDVAIVKQATGAAKDLLSVHQVKAYYSQGHLLNTYKSVFTGAPIYQYDTNGKVMKDVDGKKIETGNYEPGQWCSRLNYLHTVENIGNWPISDFSSVGGNPFNINRYEYGTNIFHCGTNEITQYILNELMSSDFHGGNHGLAAMALKRICFELDSKIRYEHASKNSKSDYEIKFSFNELMAIINSNQDISANDVYLCRKLFYDLYINAKLSSSILETSLEDVDNLVREIYQSLTDEEFLDFLRRLSLNISPDHQSLTQATFSRDGLKQVFFKILLNTSNNPPKFKKDELIVLYSSFRYVLTTIIEEQNDAEEVVKNVLQNLKSQNLLWEKTSLINKEINGSFQELNPDFFDIREKDEKEEDYNKFMLYNGSSKFICRETVKINLTDGNPN